jgi:UDP-3-O-[3-hydroxymyristoyl] glucosamine N-acyltransferase
MIAGSTIIGENVWVAPSSSIINKATVGDNAVIGLGAVVIKSVKEKEVVVGNPAKPI